MFTNAVERSLPLSVVPTKESRKLALGSGMLGTLPPRMTRPVMDMLQDVGKCVVIPGSHSQDEGNDLEEANKVGDP